MAYPRKMHQEYRFPQPAGVFTSNVGTVQPGLLPVAENVDGRVTDVLRSIAGFSMLTSGTLDAGSVLPGTFCTVSKDGSTDIGYGFLFKTGTTIKLAIFVQSPDSSTLSAANLVTPITMATSVTDGSTVTLTSHGKYFRFSQASGVSKTVWWDNTAGAWQNVNSGPVRTPAFDGTIGSGCYYVGAAVAQLGKSYASQMTARATKDNANVWHYLMSIGIGFRLGDSRRNMWSTLQTYAVTADLVTGAGADVTDLLKLRPAVRVAISLNADEIAAYDTIEFYRTVDQGATYYLERTLTAAGASKTLADLTGERGGAADHAYPLTAGPLICWLGVLDAANVQASVYNEANGTAVYYGTWDDVSLASYQSAFDEVNGATTTEPGGNLFKAVGDYCWKTSTTNTTEDTRGVVRWTRLDSQGMEQWPPLNTYRFPHAGERAQAVHVVGDNLIALTTHGIYRFARDGIYMTVQPLSDKVTVTGQYASTVVGSDLVTVTPTGILLVDSSTGTATRMAALDQVIRDVWSTSTAVQVAYDSFLDAILFYVAESTYGDCLAVWLGTNTVTRMVFLSTTTGIPATMFEVAGFMEGGRRIGSRVAWTGWQATDLIDLAVLRVVGAGGQATSGSLLSGLSLGGDMTGAITAVPAGTWINTSVFGSSPPTAVGSVIWFLQSTGAISRTITAYSSPSIKLDQDTTATTGTRWISNPLIMTVVGFPVPVIEKESGEFERKKVQQVGFRVYNPHQVAGMYAGVVTDQDYRGAIVQGTAITGLSLVALPVSTSGVPDTYWVGPTRSGRLVMPVAQVFYRSGRYVEIQAITVDGTVEDSRRT